MSQPLLSIVIPTKNRYDCLKKFVELFHSVYTSSEIQLAISDNSDDNSDFLAFLSTVDDKRILYTYTAEHISVGENSDRAILLRRVNMSILSAMTMLINEKSSMWRVS